MITLNDEVVTINSFPDGTMLLKEAIPGIDARIKWNYENDREFLALIYLTKHLRSNGVKYIRLVMPYIPNARQDRVKDEGDVFTLKYFSEVLNSLDFTSVTVLDPHSSVAEALINNIRIINPEQYIVRVLNTMEANIHFNGLIFYPDSGAAKRYSGMISLPYMHGNKNRDWKTGKIIGLDVITNGNDIAGKNILIIDDICSYGGTFLHSARKLKELGANDIYLYVSHCENSILDGELINSGLIKKIYTTDSIFTKEHELIEVLK